MHPEMIETEINPSIHHAERKELETVLSSDLFRRAPTLARILEYLCERQLRGEAFIKEYEIATQVMGRSSDFDPQQDGSVRVNLHHLRKKLRTFYETEGADHAIRITLPIGQSLPSFVEQTVAEESAAAVAEARSPSTEHEVAAPEGDTAPTADTLAPTLSPETSQKADDQESPSIHVGSRSMKTAQWLAAIFAAALLASALTWFWIHRHASLRTHQVVMTDATLRIACGNRSAFQDGAGRPWGADAYFTGGKAFHRPALSIGGTADSSIYQAGRQGNFSYDIPLSREPYELHLYFAETEMRGEGFRTMEIWINGKRVEQYFDVTSDAGGVANATEKIYTGVQPAADGKLHLQFKGMSADAFVNAIEIMPGNGESMRPIRQTALPTYYFDPQGTVWGPDMWFHGGRVNHIPDLFPKLPWEGFYQNERFGNFSYAIAVVPGRTYNLTLYFQDAWFSHEKPGAVNTGKRRFDVDCNGKQLLQQFDILQQADGSGFRVIKRFTGVQPTAQGKILLSFTPSQNYAVLNALSVEEQPTEEQPTLTAPTSH